MRQVTLNDEDVTYFRADDNGWDELKQIVSDNTAFGTYARQQGTLAALEQVTIFHRHVANQLIRAAAKDPNESSWAARAIGLCNRLRSRRRWLRGAYIAEAGQAAFDDLQMRIDMEYPRATWGEGLDDD